jgi:L-alanine-DL-glutamate epimerase-like enolase superfamily enzyme
VNLSWRVVNLRVREPHRLSASGEVDAVQLALAYESHTGYGEVVSSPHLRLDQRAITSTLAWLRQMVSGFPDPETLLAELPVAASRWSVTHSVVAALDAALHDVVGKLRGIPVHQLAGLDHWAPTETGHTIGTGTAEDAAAIARTLTEKGFRAFKIKAGVADPDEDRARVAAVRSAAPDARLVLDPGGAWSPVQAVQVLESMAELKLDAVEQPIAPGNPARMEWVAERSPAPVVADEDVTTAADVERLAGAVHGVTVKLARCGGIHAALQMIQTASTAGMTAMLGCLIGSSLGVAPAVHLAGHVRWVDLDGHLMLETDPWTGIGGANGTLRLDGSPGLGVHPTSVLG